MGGPDYGARLNQLLGSFGIFTFQYAQHQDRYATKPVGYDRPGILDCTVSPDGSSCTTAISPENPAYPPGFGPVFGPTGNNRGSRRNFGGAFTAYLGNHEVRLGGDYQDDKTRGATYFTGQSFLRVQTVPERVSEPGRHELLRSLEGAPVAECKRPYGAGLISSTRVFATGTNENDYQIVPASPFDVSTQRYSAFIQDQWRIAPTLTANLGVRWDTESFHGLDPVTGPFEAFSLTNQWSPRVGVVWDFVGDGTSKLYASAGRFYYALPMDLNVQVFTGASFVNTYNYNLDSVTQDDAAPQGSTRFGRGNAAGEPIDPGMKASYQDEFTIGIEKALDPTLWVGLKGTYRTLGRTIEDRCDLDHPTGARTAPSSTRAEQAPRRPARSRPATNPAIRRTPT